MLRTPDELNLFAESSRPEIVRHFGVHYDPAKHNKGLLWFGNEGVIITKLDTSGAVERHQYSNRFLSASRFSWTSQNQMKHWQPETPLEGCVSFSAVRFPSSTQASILQAPEDKLWMSERPLLGRMGAR